MMKSRCFLVALLLVVLLSNVAMAQPPAPGPGNPQAPQNPGVVPGTPPPPAAPAEEAGVSPLPYLITFGSTLIFLTIVCKPSRKL
jgi:hypothetical protein